MGTKVVPGHFGKRQRFLSAVVQSPSFNRIRKVRIQHNRLLKPKDRCANLAQKRKLVSKVFNIVQSFSSRASSMTALKRPSVKNMLLALFGDVGTSSTSSTSTLPGRCEEKLIPTGGDFSSQLI